MGSQEKYARKRETEIAEERKANLSLGHWDFGLPETTEKLCGMYFNISPGRKE